MGQGKEHAGGSQMGQVVPGLLPGTWVVPTCLGIGESRSGKVWVCIRGSSSLLAIFACMSCRVCLTPLCVSEHLTVSVLSLAVP